MRTGVPMPVRTCVGCGERARQRDLDRFTDAGGVLAFDRGGRAPGRGAYLHASPRCARAFARRGGLVRSLRVRIERAARQRLVAEWLIEEASK